MERGENWVLFDPGTSDRKFLAIVRGNFLGGLIPPGIRSITERPENDVDYPLGCGVIEIGEEMFVVGERPKIHRTSEFKNQSAIAVLLGLLGSLLGDSGDKLSVVLKIPITEFGMRQTFMERLKFALEKPIKVNGVPFGAKIKKVLFHAEGDGLIPNAYGQSGSIILGQSDLSVIFKENGAIASGRSHTFNGCGLGALTSHLGLRGSDLDLAYAIVQRDYSNIGFTGLSVAEFKAQRKRAIAEYFEETLRPNLKLINWGVLEECPVGGGGGVLLRSELPKGYLPKGLELREPYPMPGLELFGEDLDEDRFADIYGSARSVAGERIDAALEDINDPATPVKAEVA